MTSTNRTTSGLPLQPGYGPEDLAGWDPELQLGDPGEYPFTRGIHRGMYRDRMWTMRQYSGFGDAQATNGRFKFLYEQGERGLSLAFDLPTQLGLDSDDPRAHGEVGRLGVAVDSLGDMRTIYAGIPLDASSTSMTINATAPTILAMYVALADEQGVARADLRGTLQNDLFKEYLARGLYIFPPAASVRLTVDVIEFCLGELPRFNPVSVSAPHIRSAGAHYTHALAYMFEAARTLLSECVRRGLDVNRVGSRLSFLAGADNDFFETVARHRASRRLWARTMKQEFGATDERAQQYRLAGSGNPLNLTARQPHLNIGRIALHGLANVLGGCQSLVLPCWDEAFTIPTEDAVRTSLNLQRILAYETGVTEVVDPLAGSYFVERLTDDVEAAIRERMALVQERGGLVDSIESGWIQQEMAHHAHEVERDIQNGETTVVGVNAFAVEEDLEQLEESMHPVDENVSRSQAERLREWRTARSEDAVTDALDRVRRACADEGVNVVPVLIDAVRAGATLGEINREMVAAFGEYEPAWSL